MDWNNLKTLEELTHEYFFILLDTSAMSEGLKYMGDFLTYKEKREMMEDEHIFRNLLMDCIERKDSCWITSKVCGEYSEISSYPYMRAIRRRGSHSDREVLYILRERKYYCKEIRKLIEMFSEYGRILGLNKLNDEEQKSYHILSDEHTELQEKYKLSDTDSDFLTLGAVLSQKRGPTALVSNDFGIFRAWRDLHLNLTNHNKFDFFVRKEKGFFKKLIDYNHIKI